MSSRSAAMAQVSIRMDPATKRAGDATLAQISALVGPPPPPLSEDEMLDLLYEESLEREREVLAQYAN